MVERETLYLGVKFLRENGFVSFEKRGMYIFPTYEEECISLYFDKNKRAELYDVELFLYQFGLGTKWMPGNYRKAIIIKDLVKFRNFVRGEKGQ
jgi:hypothetical protein